MLHNLAMLCTTLNFADRLNNLLVQCNYNCADRGSFIQYCFSKIDDLNTKVLNNTVNKLWSNNLSHNNDVIFMVFAEQSYRYSFNIRRR